MIPAVPGPPGLPGAVRAGLLQPGPVHPKRTHAQQTRIGRARGCERSPDRNYTKPLLICQTPAALAHRLLREARPYSTEVLLRVLAVPISCPHVSLSKISPASWRGEPVLGPDNLPVTRRLPWLHSTPQWRATLASGAVVLYSTRRQTRLLLTPGLTSRVCFIQFPRFLMPRTPAAASSALALLPAPPPRTAPTSRHRTTG